jgi:hypothetical protein
MRAFSFRRWAASAAMDWAKVGEETTEPTGHVRVIYKVGATGEFRERPAAGVCDP